MSHFQLSLFGSPRIIQNGALIELGSRKALALFIYLVLADRAQSRESLAALFWPEQDERRARGSLRRSLWIIRQKLGDEIIITDKSSIAIRQDGSFAVDVHLFQKVIHDCLGVNPDDPSFIACVEPLTQAVALYNDDFLTGFTLPDAPAFDEWHFFQAQSLRQALSGVLQKLMQWNTHQHDYEAAIDFARRWLALDPLHEPAHRELMQLYAWSDQQAAAVRQYQKCERILDEDLGVPPEEETVALFDAIRERRLTAPTVESNAPAETAVPSSPLHPLTLSPLPAFLHAANETQSRELALFVGRGKEMGQLNTVLARAVAGEGQLFFVSGDGGRGKTSLLNAFAQRSQARYPELIVVRGTCDAHTGQGNPYLPWREALQMLTGDVESLWTGRHISRDHAQRLWRLIPKVASVLVEHGPNLLDTFISLRELMERATLSADGDATWLMRLRALEARVDQQAANQDRLFAQVLNVLGALAAQQPLLLILDDLHWVDASSADLLFHIGRRINSAPILIMGAYRGEEVQQKFDGAAHPLQNVLSELQRTFGDVAINLDEVDQSEGQAFVDALLDSEANRLDEQFRQELTARTGGHPLFTVELVREMQDRGELRQDEEERWVASSEMAWDRLPIRVEATVATRVNRLDADLRELLVIASVEGEEFTAEAVAQVQGSDPLTVVRTLSGSADKEHHLVRVQGIRRVGEQRLSRYRFRHNLFQHYLYNSLDEVERAYLHEAVGTTLEAFVLEEPQEKADMASSLAHHFEAAGLTERAVDYYLQAGNRASQLSAHGEAIDYLQSGLALVQELPKSDVRMRHEASLLVALGNALTAKDGSRLPEVAQAFQAAVDLCRQLNDTEQIFPALVGLRFHYLLSDEPEIAHQLAQEFFDRAQEQTDLEIVAVGHRLLGNSLSHSGKLVEALTHMKQGLTVYNNLTQRSPAARYGHDTGVILLGGQAWNLWFLGYPDQSRQCMQELLDLANEITHSLSRALALSEMGELFAQRREWKDAQVLAETHIRFAREEGMQAHVTNGLVIQGMSLVMQSQVAEGLALIDQVLADQGVKSLWNTRFLAETYCAAGLSQEGLTILADVLAAEGTARQGSPELYRLQGELLRQVNNGGANPVSTHVAKEDCFQKAIRLARQQQAKSLELRAAMCLFRLWQSQGKLSEAHELLAAIYSWFTEGFDTPDLRDARELLLTE